MPGHLGPRLRQPVVLSGVAVALSGVAVAMSGVAVALSWSADAEVVAAGSMLIWDYTYMYVMFYIATSSRTIFYFEVQKL